MNIPFFSFKNINAALRAEMSACFESFIDDQCYVLGPRVKAFEEQYAAYSGTAFCCGLANGFDALVLSLRALGIKPGDEVIVPSNTYIATWLAVSAVGAKIVAVEPRATTCNINPGLLEQYITPSTRAIIPVHLYGQPCEMDAIMRLAARHSLFVVEDNAQAQGAKYNGRLTGSFGNINATSFYPAKNIGAYGDAGAATTNDPELHAQVQRLRNFGSGAKYYNEEKGINSRLDELQAGLLSIKLKHLDENNAERRRIAKQYDEQLAGVADILLPSVADGAESVYHQYMIRTRARDALMQHLKKDQVGTLIHYPVPPHLQLAYAELGFSKRTFPIAEEIAGTCLSLPIYPGLSGDEIAYICESITSFCHG